MNLNKLSRGEQIASVSALALFVLMFFHWFHFNSFGGNPSLLVLLQGPSETKNAWGALDYIPFVLVVAIGVTLTVAGLRLTPGARLSARIEAAVGALGAVSALLILYRILDPPIVLVEPQFTVERTVLFPTFLALAAAIGIALGGFLAMREEMASTSASDDLQHAPPSSAPSSSH